MSSQLLPLSAFLQKGFAYVSLRIQNAKIEFRRKYRNSRRGDVVISVAGWKMGDV
jgi:hypothetical protein